MLDKILATINEKAEKEIAAVLREKEERIFQLEKKYAEMRREKKQQKRQQIVSELKEELRNFTQERILSSSFQVEKRKQEILENVYQAGKKKIEELPLEQLQNLILRMLKFLPEKTGQIKAGPKTFEILKKKELEGLEISAGLEEEGFIFVSPSFELDMRLSSYINHLRDEIDPQISKILFG